MLSQAIATFCGKKSYSVSGAAVLLTEQHLNILTRQRFEHAALRTDHLLNQRALVFLKL
jgi:hypothetical protein